MLNQKIKKFKLPKKSLEAVKQPGVTNIQGYEMDELKIIVSKNCGRWHFSVSHPYRLPFGNEIDVIKSALFPNVSMELVAIGRCVQFMEIMDKSEPNQSKEIHIFNEVAKHVKFRNN